MPDPLTLPPRAPDPAASAQAQPAAAPGQRQDLQNRFLTSLLNHTVTVYLVNGIRLSGTLQQFDSFTVLLHDANDIGTLIFKHAISTLVPGMPAIPKEPRPPFRRRAAPTE